MRLARGAVLLLLVLTACSTGEPPSTGPTRSPSQSPGVTAGPSDVATPSPSPVVAPDDLRPGIALAAVRHLAGDIGRRHATSPAFRRAAAWVAAQLRGYGLDVRRQAFRVPGGVSWGIPVDAGSSANVVATPPGFDSRRPHLVVSAHLDTVPQAPGAEDDASGVGVLLAAADALAERRTPLPVVLVAFGAEEPRGPTDADHHYGSRAYVAALDPAERRAVRGMISLDRVGVGRVVPVCTAGDDAARAEALAAGERARVPTLRCENTSSDHWSFVLAGMPGVRIGGTPYTAYHSAADVPAVVNPAQLRRTGRLVLAWLAG
jgi:aminopeptidase YwaD